MALVGRPLRICVLAGIAAAIAFDGARAVPPIPTSGRHDFDWEIGTWHTDMRRLRHPLSGSSEWLSYTGTTVVREVWAGKANLVELNVDGPAGHLQALSLRLFDPKSNQWSLNFANAAGGGVSVPAPVGEFRSGRGEFYDQERFGERTVLVRFVISEVTARSAHFEQSFSADGGRSWETNWIATDTRMGNPAAFVGHKRKKRGLR